MTFTWNDQNIRWFLNASKYTAFHKKLATCMLPAVSKGDQLYDFGCGLGLLDMELSPFVQQIHAFDISPAVISFLTKTVQNRALTNIFPQCADTNQIHDTCDVGIMSFFGRAGRDMSFYRSLCQKKLIRIVNLKNSSSLYPSQYRKTIKDTSDIVKKELILQGLPFDYCETALEFGQPFTSREDAFAFIRSHAASASQEEIDLFISAHCTETGEDNYPLYLPNEKHIGIFIIS